MANKNKAPIIAAGIIGLVILLFLFSQGFIQLPLAIGTGFTTLSLSNIQVSSNDPLVGGQAWFLTVSQNLAGQSAYADRGTIQDNTGKSSDPFQISVSLDENFANYQIFSQNVFVKTVDWDSTIYNPFASKRGCNPDVWDNWIKPRGTIKVYCYNFVDRGVYGTLGNADINFKSTISVSGNKGTDEIAISNVEQTSGFSSNGNVHAAWVGSFVTGEAPPSPFGQDIVAFYDTARQGWGTASKSAYDGWRNYDWRSCLTFNPEEGDICFNEYNNRASSFMRGKAFVDDANVATTSGDLGNGLVRLNLPRQLQFPAITMRIKADFIGINIPVGKPRIISTESLKFQTGQVGNIATTISNVGDGEGSFDVFAECSSGFSQTGGSLRVSGLSPDSAETVNIPITCSAIQEISGSCTVTARDVNNPNNFDTRSASVSCDPIRICVEGEISVIGNKIQECKNNVWVTTKQCASDEEVDYIDGIPICVKIEVERGFFESVGDYFSDLIKFTGGIFDVLRLILAIIVGIFSTLFSKDLLSGFKALKKNETVAWLIAIVIGILLAFFTWEIFWVGVVGLAIFVFFKFSLLNKLIGGK